METAQESGIRLQKYLSQCGVASRRTAETYIQQGLIKINNIVVKELGVKVYPGDTVSFHDRIVEPVTRLVYLVLNKPPGYVSTLNDEQNRPKAVDLLQDIAATTRIYNIGRLDFRSSGLLLFTNDGSFAANVMHPSSLIVKKYYVKTDKPIPFAFIENFVHGIMDDGTLLKALSVHFITADSVEIALHEGKNREIRRALAHFDLHARILKRIAIGPVTIDNLPEGAWRMLTQEEIDILYKGGKKHDSSN